MGLFSAPETIGLGEAVDGLWLVARKNRLFAVSMRLMRAADERTCLLLKTRFRAR